MEDDAFVVDASAPFSRGQELHISYGDYSNHALLLHYGFVVEGGAPRRMPLPRSLDAEMLRRLPAVHQVQLVYQQCHAPTLPKQ